MRDEGIQKQDTAVVSYCRAGLDTRSRCPYLLALCSGTYMPAALSAVAS